MEWTKTQKSLITFFQETHVHVYMENDLNYKSDDAEFCSHGITASRGVAIL